MAQKMLSHFTLVLESELSIVLETCITAAGLLDLSIKKKKNQLKPIIKEGVTVPNVQKCVMVATLTLQPDPRCLHLIIELRQSIQFF